MPKFTKKTASPNGLKSAAARKKKYGKKFNESMKAIHPERDKKTGRFFKKAYEPMCIECGCTDEKACKYGCEWAVKGSINGKRGEFWVCSRCV
jgi:hypothetical protein